MACRDKELAETAREIEQLKAEVVLCKLKKELIEKALESARLAFDIVARKCHDGFATRAEVDALRAKVDTLEKEAVILRTALAQANAKLAKVYPPVPAQPVIIIRPRTQGCHEGGIFPSPHDTRPSARGWRNRGSRY